MADGEDALVKTMQLTGDHRPFDGRMRIAKPLQLPNRDHTMLPVG